MAYTPLIVGSDLVPLRKRGIFQGLSNIPVGVGTGLGGLFGGRMNDNWGWKWAFLIQVPFIALATLLVVLFVWVPIEKATKPALRRVDYLGTMTLVGAVVLLLPGLNFGGKNLAWTHWFVITSICLTIVLFVTFVWIEERNASEPIIPVRLLLKRTVAASCLTYLFSHAANFAILFLRTSLFAGHWSDDYRSRPPIYTPKRMCGARVHSDGDCCQVDWQLQLR